MVHHVYREKKGCLVRFSLLPGGAVKKAQALGGKLRLMAFEWTHLACPQRVYERMVESMSVKIPYQKSRDEMRKEIVAKYGVDGLSGWCNRGQKIREVLDLLGKPESEEGDILTWSRREGDYLFSLEAVFTDGEFQNFRNDGWSRSWPALAGTVSFVNDSLAMEGDDPFADEEDLPEPQKETVPTKELEQIMMANKPGPESPERSYDHWLDTATDLIKSRKVNPEPYVAVMLENNRGTYEERSFIDHATADQTRRWYQGRVKELWKSKDGGKVNLRELNFRELLEFGHVIGDLGDFDPGLASDLVARLQEDKSNQGAFLAMELLLKWERAQHSAYLLKFLEALNHEFDPEAATWVFAHLRTFDIGYGQRFGEFQAAIVDEFEELRPRLEGENAALCDKVLEEIERPPKR